MSHTPGPWFVREPDGDEHTEVYSEKTGAVCYPEPDDAYLIAAAPEMLAALKELRDELNSWVWQGSVFGVSAGYHRYIEGMVSRAIAKAEGRSDEATPN